MGVPRRLRLAAIAALWATGQTLNAMTLGGLALAIGILVDDATVTIENINWHLEQGKPVIPAILDGAQQILSANEIASRKLSVRDAEKLVARTQQGGGRQSPLLRVKKDKPRDLVRLVREGA